MNVTPPPPFPSGSPAFVKELRSTSCFRLRRDVSAAGSLADADFSSGLFLAMEFPDPEGLLVTATDDLCCFLKENMLWNPEGIPILIRRDPLLTGETFRLNVALSNISIAADDTEGIRRGIYFFEEQLVAAPGPFLPIGETMRTMWLKNRISRCFFGPIKRPPFNHDELIDEDDYYPDEYLNRLAREGVNGLWLTIVFRELCSTSLFPRDPDADKRLEKLRRTVRQCRRFGIRVWGFCIEPHCWDNAFPCPENHSELRGPQNYSDFSFCPNSKTAEMYLYECSNSLFSAVPYLGGLITISLGERTTSCLSTRNISNDWDSPCGSKCSLGPDEILAKTLKPLAAGMHDASPKAELITWLYIPSPEPVADWLFRLPNRLSGEAVLAFNFESGCVKSQLGKPRCGGDYWLSCVGPSDRFKRMAAAVQNHCAMAAKLQVCCSHEIATIPFVPVPGLLYRKYAAMKRLGVEHVIQCWYFGNYPGLMNRAAGLLAGENFAGNEDEFLKRLTAVDWGSRTSEMTEVLNLFSLAYSDYPLDIQFQYYGPMHDGPVWPLHLKPVFRSLPRTWKPDVEPAGDAIGECLLNHTLREAVLLTRHLSDGWHRGTICFQAFASEFARVSERMRDASLIEALDLQFQSGADILEFYLLRNRLLDSPRNSAYLLERLKQLVREEIAISRRLAELCAKDSRLGYHSEAEVFKYYPAKLHWRADLLAQLLETDFPECQEKLALGESIGEFLLPSFPAHRPMNWYYGRSFAWQAETTETTVRFWVRCSGGIQKNEMEGVRFFLADRKTERFPIEIAELKRNGSSHSFSSQGRFFAEEKGNEWLAMLEFPRAALDEEFRFGLLREFNHQEAGRHFDSYPAGDFSNCTRLNLDYYDPSRMVPVVI